MITTRHMKNLWKLHLRFFVYIYQFLFIVHERQTTSMEIKTIYLRCGECFGHRLNPSANPLCEYGCNKIYTYQYREGTIYFKGEPTVMTTQQVNWKHSKSTAHSGMKINNKENFSTKKRNKLRTLKTHRNIFYVHDRNNIQQKLSYGIPGTVLFIGIIVIAFYYRKVLMKPINRVSYTDQLSLDRYI